MLADPSDYPSRIEWVGSIRFHLEDGREVVARRVVLATTGDFLDGEIPDYSLYVEAPLGELRKLGLPPGLLPEGPAGEFAVLALEAPTDMLTELNTLGATRDLDTLMGDDRFLDLAFHVERLRPSYAHALSGDGATGVAA